MCWSLTASYCLIATSLPCLPRSLDIRIVRIAWPTGSMICSRLLPVLPGLCLVGLLRLGMCFSSRSGCGTGVLVCSRPIGLRLSVGKGIRWRGRWKKFISVSITRREGDACSSQCPTLPREFTASSVSLSNGHRERRALSNYKRSKQSTSDLNKHNNNRRAYYREVIGSLVCRAEALEGDLEGPSHAREREHIGQCQRGQEDAGNKFQPVVVAGNDDDCGKDVEALKGDRRPVRPLLQLQQAPRKGDVCSGQAGE